MKHPRPEHMGARTGQTTSSSGKLIDLIIELVAAALIGQLKGPSSHRVNESFVSHHSFAWQAEYGVFSFSEQSLSMIGQYLKNQKKHHAENSVNLTMEDFDTSI